MLTAPKIWKFFNSMGPRFPGPLLHRRFHATSSAPAHRVPLFIPWQEDYKLVLPFHGGAFTRDQALQAVESWPDGPLSCRPYPGPEITAGKPSAGEGSRQDGPGAEGASGGSYGGEGGLDAVDKESNGEGGGVGGGDAAASVVAE